MTTGARLTLGSSPKALTLADGKLWAVAVLPLGGHRGGVLRVEVAASACRCVDPAWFAELGSETDLAVPLLLYDGLVSYRHVGGVAGGRLVPNLAVRLPTPTTRAGRTPSSSAVASASRTEPRYGRPTSAPASSGS